MESCQQSLDADPFRGQAGCLAGGGASLTWKSTAQLLSSGRLIVKPHTAQQLRGIQLSAGFCTWCILTEHAVDHISAV